MAILASLAGPSRPASGEFTFEVVKSFERLPWIASELAAGPDGALYGTSEWGLHGSTVLRIDSMGMLKILHVFDPQEEGYPSGNALTVGSDGALYGTTGSAYSAGTIFKIDATGAFTVLHSFDGEDGFGGSCGRLVLGSDGVLYAICPGGIGTGTGTLIRIDSEDGFSLLHTFGWADGYPQGSLTVGSDGAFYGTTGLSVFRMDDAGTVTPIYYFTDADGEPEKSALTLGSDGALYGTTSSTSPQGQSDAGTVFRIDSAGNFSTLHTFSGPDGFDPSALTLGSDGALYGTTLYGGTTYAGGSWGYGTVFRIDSAGSFASLHSFSPPDGLPGCCGIDRAVTLGSDGALYGVTGGGSVFRIDRAGTFTALHSFANSGQGLRYPLVLGADGALYGITEGRPFGYLGSVFKIDSEGNFSSLRSFSDSKMYIEGSGPAVRLVAGTDDALYGTTTAGGSADAGTVFRLDSARAFQSLVSLPSGYYDPPVELVVGTNGILYGSLPYAGGSFFGEGGPSAGSVFGVDPGGNYTVVHEFDWSGPYFPGPLTVGADGALWGTTLGYDGAIFRIDSAGAFDSLYAGVRPSSLTVGPDGALFGTNSASFDGAYGGAVFRIDDALMLTVLHVFEDRAAEGYGPVGPLSLGNDGALYGATATGGSADLGTLFRIDAAGGFSSLHSFSGTDGGSGITRLVAGADGAMYGTSPSGGSSDCGTVFRIDGAGAFTLLHSFSDIDGAYPTAALILGSDGALYGSTRRGGSSDVGTIFRVDPSGRFESLHSFTGADGAKPFTALVRGSDDALYGTTPEGGPGGGGVVYRVPEPGRGLQLISCAAAQVLLVRLRGRRTRVKR